MVNESRGARHEAQGGRHESRGARHTGSRRGGKSTPPPGGDPGVGTSTLVGVAVVFAALAYAGLKLWIGSGRALPETGWFGLAFMLPVSVGVAAAGWWVRSSGRGTTWRRRASALESARVVALAQTVALAGAGLVGWYLAQVVIVLPDSDVASQRSRLYSLIGMVIGAVVMSGAGLVAQSFCRSRSPSR